MNRVKLRSIERFHSSWCWEKWNTSIFKCSQVSSRASAMSRTATKPNPVQVGTVIWNVATNTYYCTTHCDKLMRGKDFLQDLWNLNNQFNNSMCLIDSSDEDKVEPAASQALPSGDYWQVNVLFANLVEYNLLPFSRSSNILNYLDAANKEIHSLHIALSQAKCDTAASASQASHTSSSSHQKSWHADASPEVSQMMT